VVGVLAMQCVFERGEKYVCLWERLEIHAGIFIVSKSIKIVDCDDILEIFAVINVWCLR